MKSDLAKLANDGVSYIQIDAPRYSYYMDPEVARMDSHRNRHRSGRRSRRSYPSRQRLLSRRPRPGVTLGIHLCRAIIAATGTPKAATTPSPKKMFSTLDVDRFFLEYDDARSGTFEPLRFIPKEKRLSSASSAPKSPK